MYIQLNMYIQKGLYRVIFPDSSLLIGQLDLDSDAHVCYTERSPMNRKPDAGVYGPEQ